MKGKFQFNEKVPPSPNPALRPGLLERDSIAISHTTRASGFRGPRFGPLRPVFSLTLKAMVCLHHLRAGCGFCELTSRPMPVGSPSTFPWALAYPGPSFHTASIQSWLDIVRPKVKVHRTGKGRS